MLLFHSFRHFSNSSLVGEGLFDNWLNGAALHVQIRRLTEQWRGVQSVKELHISHTSGLLGASRTLHVQFKCEHPVSALFNRFNFYVLNGPSQIFEASTFLFSPRSTLIDYWTTSLRIFIHLNVVLQASQDLSIQKSTKGPWHGGHLASNSDWLEYLDLTTHMTARKCVPPREHPTPSLGIM